MPAMPDEEILVIDSELSLHGVCERLIDPLWQAIDRHRAWLQLTMNWPQEMRARADIERHVQGSMLLHLRGYSKMYLVMLAGNLVGVVSFNQIEPTNQAAWIGYWRVPDCPRKGVISRALQTLMTHYSRSGQIRRFAIKCIVSNHPSIRLALRNGFCLEGCLREAEWLNGQFHDQNIYARIWR